MSTTWYEVEQAAKRWAIDDWRDGNYDTDNVDEWAHETADGCEYVIYYHHQNALWSSSDYVRSFEDMVYGVDDTQQRIQACVYYAIYEACMEAANEIIESESVFSIGRVERTIWVRGERVKIPVLAARYTNPNK